jgi:hypothetical protein
MGTYIFKKIILVSLILFAVSGKAQIVKISNTINQIKDNTYRVCIEVERGTLDADSFPGLKTFFQISYGVPKNIQVLGIYAHGGEYSFENDTLRYTWYNLPKEDFIEVLFKAVLLFKQPTELTGTYYYLVNEEKQIFDLPRINLK